MNKFAELLDRLYFTYSHLSKTTILKEYLSSTNDPDRGYAVSVIAGTKHISLLKRGTIKEIIYERVDPILFDLSYDYIGDLAETIALLWPRSQSTMSKELPTLAQFITDFESLTKEQSKAYIIDILDRSDTVTAWACLKLVTGSLRIGVSARFMKQVLAEYGQKELYDIEQVWHGLKPPYTELFAWLENKAPKPDIQQQVYFHPVMLAQPLDDETLIKLDLNQFAIERKYDGIRVQLVSTSTGRALYSRKGEEISSAFPDVLDSITWHGVLDGELVIYKENDYGSFNELQQRLNRKRPTKKLLQTLPGHVILYDILFYNNLSFISKKLVERKKLLNKWYQENKPQNMSLSNLLNLTSFQDVNALRQAVIQEKKLYVEGIMLKKLDSPYIPGRPSGYWYKWKKDPHVIDAVLMYAQRGHGKRSSYYSDYTFGLWKEDVLLPIGKAYSGFTDEELYQLDKWIRQHTIKRYGPVREVEKQLVFEIAFDAIQYSSRHKSGLALRFPRISRIRWDKPANEADTIESANKLII